MALMIAGRERRDKPDMLGAMPTDLAASTERFSASISRFLSFRFTSAYARRPHDRPIADFTFGNPHEMPLPGLVSALKRHAEPRDEDWFAYKTSEPEATRIVAASLQRRTQVAFEPEDVFMTNGAYGAISVVLRAIVDPGDEVIFLSPPWFFYEALIECVGGRAVRVGIEPPAFDLPLDAIAAAITERTRAVILNTPQNPTGRVYSLADLTRLAAILASASERIGRPVRILADESYNRILYDGRVFHSPAEVYPETFVVYTYGKTLLAPSERIGYIAVPPAMQGRERVRRALLMAQLMTGFAFPNGVLQRALGDLEALSIDLLAVGQRRDRMVAGLRGMGYELCVPEGTFYMMVQTPIDDDQAFCDRLAEHDTFVLPGSVIERTGWFRISLTASDEMVERGLRGFDAARGA